MDVSGKRVEGEGRDSLDCGRGLGGMPPDEGHSESVLLTRTTSAGEEGLPSEAATNNSRLMN